MSSCAICLEQEMVSPAACVPCGHTFCHSCILQWTRAPPRFGLSLCPQCRSPVREVQKLFISDWPVSGSGSSGGVMALTQLSAWQQFSQLLTLLMHFLSIPFHSLAHYGPEVGRRLTEWLNQQAERLHTLQARIVLCAALCVREWHDLGRQAQCFVGVCVLLVLLLLVQDLQDQEGIHRGIVLPILLLLVDIVQQTLFTMAFLLFRPLSCVIACGLEVGVAGLDVAGVVVWWAVRVVWDVVCVPWLVVCVLARMLCSLLSLVAGVVRVVMFILVLAVSLGLPAFLASADWPGGQLPQMLQSAMDWLRQLLLHYSRQAALRLQQYQEQQQQNGRAEENDVGLPNLMAQGFITAMVQELNNLNMDGAEGVEEVAEGEVGGGADWGWEDQDLSDLVATLEVDEGMEVRERRGGTGHRLQV